MSGDSKFFHSKLSFPAGLTDPVDQLNAIVTAMNIDAPEISPVAPYKDAKYPAAIVHLFERGLERTIVLMNAGNDRWLYVGAQSQEVYFKYYEDAVFKPATDSLNAANCDKGIVSGPPNSTIPAPIRPLTAAVTRQATSST
jgi:hypothetical protein